jgi:hypothetical protein
VRKPGCEGENVTLTLQLAPGRSCAGQLAKNEKSAVLLVMLSPALSSPVFVTVTVWLLAVPIA